MNRKANTILMLVAILSLTIVVNSFSIVFADEDFAMMNPVLVTFVFIRDTCKHEQRHDEIAETPCYNKDRSS